MTEHSGEIEPGRISDFGDKDTEHIARFLEHSGAPTMAALVRQRWADQQEMAAAVNGAARPFSFSDEARKALGRALDDSLLSGSKAEEDDSDG